MEYVIPSKDAQPVDVAIGKKSVIWYADSANNQLGFLNTKTGKFESIDIPTPNSGLSDITLSHSGHLWYASAKSGKIGAYNIANKSFYEYQLPSSAGDPQALKLYHGKLWFTAKHSNTWGYLDIKTEEIKVFQISTPNAQPLGLTVAPNGKLWMAFSGTNQLAWLDPKEKNLHLHVVTIPYLDARPRQIVVDHTGIVWYTDYGQSKIGQYNSKRKWLKQFETSNKQSGPSGIALAEDGSIWFCEAFTNSIMGLHPKTNRLTLVEIPTDGAVAGRIVMSLKHHRLWFPLTGTQRIGMLSLAKTTQ